MENNWDQITSHAAILHCQTVHQTQMTWSMCCTLQFAMHTHANICQLPLPEWQEQTENHRLLSAACSVVLKQNGNQLQTTQAVWFLVSCVETSPSLCKLWQVMGFHFLFFAFVTKTQHQTTNRRFARTCPTAWMMETDCHSACLICTTTMHCQIKPFCTTSHCKCLQISINSHQNNWKQTSESLGLQTVPLTALQCWNKTAIKLVASRCFQFQSFSAEITHAFASFNKQQISVSFWFSKKTTGVKEKSSWNLKLLTKGRFAFWVTKRFFLPTTQASSCCTLWSMKFFKLKLKKISRISKLRKVLATKANVVTLLCEQHDHWFSSCNFLKFHGSFVNSNPCKVFSKFRVQ